MTIQTPYDIISDYLNNHLSPEDTEQFEQKLATDKNLQQQVALEQKIKNSEINPEHQVTPDFSRFEEKLNKQEQPLWVRLPAPAIAACFLAAIGFMLLPESYRPDHTEVLPAEYTTLSSSDTLPFDVIRVVATDPEALQQLVSEYELTIVRSFPAASAADVAVTVGAGRIIQSAESDQRILLTHRIKTQNQ